MEVFAHQRGGQVDDQRQHHQNGGDGEGHVKFALLLGVDVQGHGKGSACVFQAILQVVEIVGEARRIQQRRRLAQNSAHRHNAAGDNSTTVRMTRHFPAPKPNAPSR